MARNNTSIDRLAAASARQAQSEMAMMQRDLKALRDKFSSLAAKAPVIKTPRHTIKKTTNSPTLLNDLGSYVTQDVLGALGLGSGGYSSASQSAGNMMAELALGQRIR